MPTYRDEGVVLRTQKLGEADRIVTLLTRKRGKIRAVAKGVRRTASKFGSRLEPFMVADMQFYQGKSLDTITQAETLASFGAEIAADYSTYTSANVMVELAERLTEAEQSEQQYYLLLGALRALAHHDHAPELVLDSYLLRSLALAGWAVICETCAQCGQKSQLDVFVPHLGGALCVSCAPAGSAKVRPETLEVLQALLAGDWVFLESHTPTDWAIASTFVSAFTQWHLERGLTSLTHVVRA